MKLISLVLIIIGAVIILGGCESSSETIPEPAIEITPDEPTTADDLIANTTTPGGEPGKNGITYKYEWYLEDSLQTSLTANNVPSSETAKGQTWRVVVTPTDGSEDGPSAEASTTVINTPPTAATINISPASPSPIDDLSVAIENPSIDVDGDQVTYQYKWHKDGDGQNPVTSPILGASHTSIGDTWQITVTPTDGEANGPASSADITLGNSPPTKPAIAILPDQPLTEDSLTASITRESTDVDGDQITYQYEWYKNESLQSAIDESTVPASLIKSGDTWQLIITPHDGKGPGPSANDSVRIADIAASDPVGDATYTPETEDSNQPASYADIVGLSISFDGNDCRIDIALDELPAEQYPHQAAHANPDYLLWVSVDIDNNQNTGIQTSGPHRKGEEYFIEFKLGSSSGKKAAFRFPEDMNGKVLVPQSSNPSSAQTPGTTANLSLTADRETESLIINDSIPGVSTSSRFTVYVNQFIGEISAADYAGTD